MRVSVCVLTLAILSISCPSSAHADLFENADGTGRRHDARRDQSDRNTREFRASDMGRDFKLRSYRPSLDLKGFSNDRPLREFNLGNFSERLHDSKSLRDFSNTERGFSFSKNSFSTSFHKPASISEIYDLLKVRPLYSGAPLETPSIYDSYGMLISELDQYGSTRISFETLEQSLDMSLKAPSRISGIRVKDKGDLLDVTLELGYPVTDESGTTTVPGRLLTPEEAANNPSFDLRNMQIDFGNPPDWDGTKHSPSRNPTRENPVVSLSNARDPGKNYSSVPSRPENKLRLNGGGRGLDLPSADDLTLKPRVPAKEPSSAEGPLENSLSESIKESAKTLVSKPNFSVAFCRTLATDLSDSVKFIFSTLEKGQSARFNLQLAMMGNEVAQQKTKATASHAINTSLAVARNALVLHGPPIGLFAVYPSFARKWKEASLEMRQQIVDSAIQKAKKSYKDFELLSIEQQQEKIGEITAHIAFEVLTAKGITTVASEIAAAGALTKGVKKVDELPEIEREFEKLDTFLPDEISTSGGRAIESNKKPSTSLELNDIDVDTVAGSRWAKNRLKDIVIKDADEVNEALRYSGPPYLPGSKILEGVTIHPEKFVRVHTLTGGAGPMGRWIIKKESIRGLTPLEIKNKFSLPEMPTHITEVDVPAGTRIRRGLTNSNFGGRANSIQYDLVTAIPGKSFSNTRKLP